MNGRHPTRMTDKKAVYLGIDIGGSFVKYGAINGRGKVQFSSRTPTNWSGKPKEMVRALNHAVEDMVQECDKRQLAPHSLGIGTPGTVDTRSGRITGQSPNLPGWVGVNVRREITEVDVPIAVDNDANCTAYAEFAFGAAAGKRNAIALTIGTGIGAGIIIDSQLFHGTHDAGAELGHLSINAHGPRCQCGNRGCLELYVSATAMLRRAEKIASFYPHSPLAELDYRNGGDETLSGIFRAAQKDNTPAQELIEQIAEEFAVGLAGMVNAFDPEMIVLGGGVVDAAPQYVEKIAHHTMQHVFKAANRRLEIVPAKLGNDAGYIGAAALGKDFAGNNHAGS